MTRSCDERPGLAVVAAFVTLVACDASGSGGPIVPDVDGVRIVEHVAIPADLESWSVADTPTLSLGAVDGAGPDVFGRVAALVERADGAIVVADAQAFEIRAFDAQGRHLWTAASEGGGPGELRGIERLLLLPADSVVVVDGRQQRALVFDPAGRLAREFLLESSSPERGRPHIIGALASGRLVGWFNAGAQSEGLGRHRDTIGVALFSSEGVPDAAFAQLPATERVVISPEPGMIVQGVAPLGRRTELAVGGGAIAATAQDRFEITPFDSAGAADMILRVATPAVVADRTVRARFGMDDDHAVHIPDTLPALGRIRLDAERRLWAEEYVARYEERTPVWWVFDAAGTPIARVRVPPRFTLYSVAADHVVGVVLDSLDVPRVEVRRILRR
jgi:hypothetical protein